MAYQEESFLGSGDLQIAVYDPLTSELGPEVDVGNASSFVINPPKLEKKELIGYRRANYATTIKSVITKSEQEVKFTLTDINRHNLMLAMFGTDSDDDAQTAGTSTSSPEEVECVSGGWVPLLHNNLDPATTIVVKDKATGAITYEEGEDYEIDYSSGRIKALPSPGTITDGETVTVVYGWSAVSGYTITANDVNKYEVQLRLLGKDQANNRDLEVTVWKAQIEPSGDLAWLTDDFATLEFTGKILATSHGTWQARFLAFSDPEPQS